jgi:stage II sporulation protein D
VPISDQQPESEHVPVAWPVRLFFCSVVLAAATVFGFGVWRRLANPTIPPLLQISKPQVQKSRAVGRASELRRASKTVAGGSINGGQADQADEPKTVAGDPVFQLPATIRVALFDQPPRQVTVAVGGPYLIESPTGKIYDSGSKLARTEFRVATSGQGFTWGSQREADSPIVIMSQDDWGVEVNGTRYRGRLLLRVLPQGKLQVVNQVDREAYLASVVDSEMPAAFPHVAREVQAIIARTYAVAQQLSARSDAHFDLFASERSQKYLGREYTHNDGRRLRGESPSSVEACAATKSLVLTDNQGVFTAYYSAVCGGCTVSGLGVFDSASPVHQSVVCTDCKEAQRYRWQTRISEAEMVKAANGLTRGFQSQTTSPTTGSVTLMGSGRRFRQLSRVIVRGGLDTGRMPEVELADGEQQLLVDSQTLRTQLGTNRLPGSRYELSLEENGHVVAYGRGHGHGVGLCQWGARGMALAGSDVTTILKRYYPGAQLKRLPDSAPVQRVH